MLVFESLAPRKDKAQLDVPINIFAVLNAHKMSAMHNKG